MPVPRKVPVLNRIAALLDPAARAGQAAGAFDGIRPEFCPLATIRTSPLQLRWESGGGGRATARRSAKRNCVYCVQDMLEVLEAPRAAARSLPKATPPSARTL